MAVGFTPKYIEAYPLDDLPQNHFLVLATEAVRELKWQLNYLSQTGLIAYTDNGMFGWNASIRIVIENDVATIKSSSAGNEMIDFGRNKTTVGEFTDALAALKNRYASEDLDIKYQQLKESFPPADEGDYLQAPPLSNGEQIKGFFSVFKPREGYFFTPILVILNILVFILMAINGVGIVSPTTMDLLKWGADFGPSTLNGEWWRLLSSAFLHAGIFHLLFNMYALIYVGLLLEPHLGKLRFITAYILTALTASITSLWWHPTTVSVGASGAIFGMYGVFLALLTTDFIEKSTRKALLTSIAIFVGYNLLYGVKEGIDNAAHIGGLAGGLIIGYCFVPGLRKPTNKRLNYAITGALAFIIIATCGLIYKNIPNDAGDYDAGMAIFSQNEQKAMEVYKLKNVPDAKVLASIKDGIYYWNEDIKLLARLDKLDVPEPIKLRDKKLLKYLQLRVKCFEAMYKCVSEHTDKYNEDIKYYNHQTQLVLDELK